ncbi:MAG: hypothetical protein HC894_16545 [Microcoleus sp. SM1_3_4]|nr:hypothetical protein [Microcoleus sp. SM1_3_4]
MRLVALLGMGGIGKTALSVKLAQQIQQDFDWIVWRSLDGCAPLKYIFGRNNRFDRTPTTCEFKRNIC